MHLAGIEQVRVPRSHSTPRTDALPAIYTLLPANHSDNYILGAGADIRIARDDELTYNSFAPAIGIAMTVVLPSIAIFSVTSEWSQRSGLTTFTLVPHRGRVISSKAISSVGVGVGVAVVSTQLTAGIGALGKVVGRRSPGSTRLGHYDHQPAHHRPGRRARYGGWPHARRSDPWLHEDRGAGQQRPRSRKPGGVGDRPRPRSPARASGCGRCRCRHRP